MSCISFDFDLQGNETTIVPNNINCINCLIQKKVTQDFGYKLARCLCWECVELAVLGHQILIEYDTTHKEWVYFVADTSAGYKVSDPEISIQRKKAQHFHITLVPSSNIMGELPNCAICIRNAGFEKKSKLMGRQFCWQCLRK